MFAKLARFLRLVPAQREETAMNFNEIEIAAREYAESEMKRYGLPTRAHFDISLSKALEMCKVLGGRPEIVTIGACLMDIKLGQAFSEKRLDQHVEMGVDAARNFLSRYSLRKEDEELILNCVAAHHGSVPFAGLEPEIVANADCYRFIHPRGVFDYIQTLAKRDLTDEQRVDAARSKLEEKYGILSLDYAKSDLERFYHYFSEIFASVKESTKSSAWERAVRESIC